MYRLDQVFRKTAYIAVAAGCCAFRDVFCKLGYPVACQASLPLGLVSGIRTFAECLCTFGAVETSGMSKLRLVIGDTVNAATAVCDRPGIDQVDLPARKIALQMLL